MLSQLASTEADVAEQQLRADGDVTAAERITGEGIEQSLAALWNRIGASQWKAGQKEAAEQSFDRAMKASLALEGGKEVHRADLGALAGVPAEVGATRRAVDTLAQMKKSVDDEILGDIGVALVKAGDVKSSGQTRYKVVK